MVNTGKPSKGCYMCRARRIKCDEAKPHCNRCQKSKRICPGYREILDTNHRDEMKLTKRKISRFGEEFVSIYAGKETAEKMPMYYAGASSMAPSHNLTYDHRANQSSSRGHSRQSSLSGPIALVRQVSTPLDQQSTCFFLANYVQMPQGGKSTQYLEFLIPLLKTAQPGSALDLTFSAVSAAAFASRPNSKALLPQVDQYYVKALKEINIALKDPLTAKDDKTLAAVVLLSTYETIMSSRKTSSSWVCHVGGSVALVAARSKETFKSPPSTLMFKSVRVHMTIQSVARSVPMGPGIEWWMSQIDEDDQEGNFHHLNLKVAQLRIDAEDIITVAARTSKSIENVLKLLRRAESLQEEYAAWYTPEWTSNTIAFIDSVEGNVAESPVHPGRIESFDDFHIAISHNMAGACRLFIWDTVVRCIAWLGEPQDYRLTPEFTVAARASAELITDIVACVPYFLGTGSVPSGHKSSYNFGKGGNNGTDIKPAAALFMLWPMFTACTSDYATESQKKYLKGRLSAVYDQTGLSQVLVLIDQSILCHPSAYIQRERHNHGSQIPRNSPKVQGSERMTDLLLREGAKPGPTEQFQKTGEILPLTTRRSISPQSTVPSLPSESSVSPSATPPSAMETYPSFPEYPSHSPTHSLSSSEFTMEGLSMSSPTEEDLTTFDPSLRWMQDWDFDEGNHLNPNFTDLEATSNSYHLMDTTTFINHEYEPKNHEYDFSQSFLSV